jgi:hypothetical protein
MSRVSEVFSFLDGLSRLSRQQTLLRVLVAGVPLIAFGLEVQAGASVQTLPVLLVVGFTVISALAPDSHGPLGVLLVLGIYWTISVDEVLSWQVLLIAVLLVVFHVLCLLASYGPPSVVLDPPLLRLWLRRSAVLVAVAVLVWVAARIATGLDLPASGWLLAAGLLVVLAWTGLLSRKLAVDAG